MNTIARFFCAVILVIAVDCLSRSAAAQNYEAMIQQMQQREAALAAQMQQTQQNIVQQNMQNPQVQALYQNYRNSGGTMSFESFAYNYAATGGFTPEGKARHYQNEQNIQRRDMDAYNAYRQSQQNSAQAIEQMNRSADNRARMVGNLMSGTSDYIEPGATGQYNLPANIQPDSYYYDRGSGQTFYNDPSGNYYRADQDGSWHGLQDQDE